MAQTVSSEADGNYEAFIAVLPTLLPKFAGRYALMHRREIVEYYDSSLDATLAGIRRYGESQFSVQEVAAKPEHLGFYSYVGGAGSH